jgi:molecular chaperone GrpE (heat shock protein)
VAHLLTQADLLERDGKPIQAQDVLTVARRLVRVLEDHGLTLEGSVGETLPFDPNRHEPLSAEAALQPGEPAVIKFVGASYGGKVLKKSGVARP